MNIVRHACVSTSMLGFAACVPGGPENEDVTRIGGERIHVQLASPRTTIASPSWKEVQTHLDDLSLDDLSLDDLSLDERAATTSFAPAEGLYTLRDIVFTLDGCELSPGGIPLDHSIRDVDAGTRTYIDDAVSDGEVFESLDCQYWANLYRCDTTQSMIDFADHELDAVVTITNHFFGRWSKDSRGFDGVFPFSFRCEGADCDEEPASNFFGSINAPMPCEGLNVRRFRRSP